jgi:hypothetical protein
MGKNAVAGMVLIWVGLFAGNAAVAAQKDCQLKRYASYYRAMKLHGVGLDVINARIQLVEKPGPQCYLSKRLGAAAYRDCYTSHPLELGLNVLTKLRLYIAMKEGVLYFTRATPSG